MSRGAGHWIEGGDDEAKELGLDPISTGIKTEDEGLYITQHSYWQREMQAAVAAESAEQAAVASSNGHGRSN
jgi:benzoate/toluate 1,2-dioxygenase alpha subunit